MEALWMVLAAFLFASMGVCVKFASVHFGSAELVFYRGIIGVIFLWGLARAQRISLATEYPAMHAWRSLVGVGSLAAWFYAIAHLPLATAMTLNYMSSIWIAAFLAGGALLAWRPGSKEKPQLPGSLALAVMVGFGGVVLLLRPTLAREQLFAALIGVFSGLTAAFAYLQVVALSRLGEPEARTVFYFALGSALAGAVAMLVLGDLSALDRLQALWLLPIGLLAALGQLCMTRAYAGARSHGATLVVANLQYSGIVFAAAYGIVLFGDELPAAGWAGMALIVASGIVATILRERAAPDAPGEEH